jgi:hypothetical protein
MNVMFCTHIVRSQTLRVAQLTFRRRNGDTCTISFEKISFEVAQPRNQSDTEHLVVCAQIVEFSFYAHCRLLRSLLVATYSTGSAPTIHALPALNSKYFVWRLTLRQAKHCAMAVEQMR